MSLEQLNDYFNSLRDFLILDNKSHLQFKIMNWDSKLDINVLLPNNLSSYPFISYYISLSGSRITKDEVSGYITNLSTEEILKLNIHINITIKKHDLITFFTQESENTYLFFSLNNFVTHINTDSNSDINNENYVNLYIIDNNIYKISNEYLNIIPFTNLNTNQTSNLSPKAIEKFQTIEKIYGDTKKIRNLQHLPSFWSINSNNQMFQQFNHLFLLNTLNLISNKSNLTNSSFVIKGHYNLNITFDVPAPELNHTKLEELLEFTIDEDTNRHVERILIVRNVLTTYLSVSSTANEFNEKLAQIVSTIWHHFELYIQNEIKVFMDQKNKLLQESVTVADKIAQLNIKNNEFFQKNIIIILGLVISNFIPLFKEITNPIYYNLLTISVVILISILNLKAIRDAESQLKNSINKFEFYVENISNKNLNGLSIEELKSKFINPDKEILESNLKIQRNISYLVIFITFIIFIWLIQPNFFKSTILTVLDILQKMKDDFYDLFNPTTK